MCILSHHVLLVNSKILRYWLDLYEDTFEQLLHRPSDWLWSHNFELISTCETAESEDRGGEGHYPR